MATGVLCAFALLATPPSSSVRETAETKLVEYFNGTLSIPKPRVEGSALVSKAKGCLGSPPCSAHGKCHESKSASGGFSTFSCKCEGGYFGKGGGNPYVKLCLGVGSAVRARHARCS